MDELAQALAVWRHAQEAVIAASEALFDDSGDVEKAREDYEYAVMFCSMAKEHYDAIRAEQAPIADDITGKNLRCLSRAG